MEKISILHISDMQFGRNHRFSRQASGQGLMDMGRLIDSLKTDITALKREEAIQIDLVIVTGDLTEWGLKTEFDESLRFLRDLMDFIKPHFGKKLGNNESLMRRLCVIPGNHDVNWELCKTHFASRAAHELEPKWPWPEKWKFYSDFFAELYKEQDLGDLKFDSEKKPWTIFKIDSLRTVVAGLNSTMDNGCTKLGENYAQLKRKPRDVGFLGDEQREEMSKMLKHYRDKSWLRIGMVHHNQQRGSRYDQENLEDADFVRSQLGGDLNVLLHGHTHSGDVGWLDHSTPILSTGSSGLDIQQRPAEIPNQYQIIELHRDGFRRISRSYQPAANRWGPDTSIGISGTHERLFEFEDIEEAFPKPETEAGWGSLVGKPWITKDMVAQHFMESLNRLFEEDAKCIERDGVGHYIVPVRRMQLSMLVRANCLFKEAGLSEYDELSFKTVFEVEDKPLHCLPFNFAWPVRPSRFNTGPVNWSLKSLSNGDQIMSQQVIGLPVLQEGGTGNSRRMLLWFVPPLPPGKYEILINQKLKGAMDKLMLGESDTVSLTSFFAKGPIDLMEVALEGPAFLTNALRHDIDCGGDVKLTGTVKFEPSEMEGGYFRWRVFANAWPKDKKLAMHLKWKDQQLRRESKAQCHGLATRLGIRLT